jgi:DNA-binding MarR family transcriptional regulator
MSKPSARSTLYRLIEAGQLAHKALLVPLLERGLEPGDDAVLFVLGRAGTTEAELAAELGLEGEALERRLTRLSERELIARQAVGPQLQPGLALTERGERMKSVLAGNWEELENALLGELKKKQRKRLGAVLQRFVELLRL